MYFNALTMAGNGSSLGSLFGMKEFTARLNIGSPGPPSKTENATRDPASS